MSLYRSLLLVVLGCSTIAIANAAEEDCRCASLPDQPTADFAEAVSVLLGHPVLIDSRVEAAIVMGTADLEQLTYPIALHVLRNNWMALVKHEGASTIIPAAYVREYPIPRIRPGDTGYEEGEWVMVNIRTEALMANFLVPILRTLLPQEGYLTGLSQTSEVTAIGRYDEVRRLWEQIADMEAAARKPEASGINPLYLKETHTSSDQPDVAR